MTLDAALVDRLLGRLAVSSGAATFPVIAPFTGSVLFDLPLAGEADVDAAIADLRRGQRAWAARPLAERSAIMLRFHDLVLAERETGLDIAQWETGKARRENQARLKTMLQKR